MYPEEEFRFSCSQKIALFSIMIGGVLVTAGGFAPYWIASGTSPSLSGTQSSTVGTLMTTDSSEEVGEHFGLFQYCAGVPGEETTCRWFGDILTFGDDWFWCRVSAAVCVFLALDCGMTALFMALCNCSCCKRLLQLGILAFLSGGTGAFAAGYFYKNMEAFTSSVSGFSITSLDWAFYVFSVGAGCITIASFIACFSRPYNGNRVHAFPTRRYSDFSLYDY